MLSAALHRRARSSACASRTHQRSPCSTSRVRTPVVVSPMHPTLSSLASPSLACASSAGDASGATTATATTASGSSRVVQLKAVPLTAEAFKPFGQVIGSSHDGKAFDSEDAQLVLDKGTPRFYIMRLPKRGLRFHRITYHAKCTQCLGGLFPVGRWFMAVAAPSGSVDNYPRQEDMTVFEIPHGCYVKMNEGTWHAGPLFHESDFMDFYNLELSDTNVTDHNTHDFKKVDGVEFEVVV